MANDGNFRNRQREVVSEQLNMSTRDLQKYQVYNDEVYERRTVHTFTMGDVEDPDIYIATPIIEWQQTEHGKWVMKHGKDPIYHIQGDPMNYGYRVVIQSHITPKRWTEYVLRGWYTG